MPHISKRLLQKEQFIEMHKQLYKIINDFSKINKTSLLLDTILTKTEKIMLSKRLAIVLLLDQGETIYAIENTLKVSPSTVARISNDHENGKFSKMLNEIKKTDIWDEIKKIIPPRVGRNRFKNFLNF